VEKSYGYQNAFIDLIGVDLRQLTGNMLGNGERKPEGASLAWGAFQTDLAAVGFDNVFGDGQTQSCSFSDTAGNPKILIKDLILIFFGYPLPGVRQLEFNAVIRRKGADFDGPTARGVPDGVGDEIGKHQFQAVGVGKDLIAQRGQILGQGKPSLLGHQAVLAEDVFHEGENPDVNMLQFDFSRLNADDIQDVVHQVLQTLGILSGRIEQIELFLGDKFRIEASIRIEPRGSDG
jgi:hypothetical protein